MALTEDTGGIVAGAAEAGLAGAAAGSIVPGIGTLIGAGVGLAGFAFKTWGTAQGISDQKNYSQQQVALETQKVGIEQKVEAQRHQAMVNDNQRRQLEGIRAAQKAGSAAMAYGVNTNAQFGSGLKGGLAQVRGEEGWNFTGLAESRAIGENVFGLNSQLSMNKIMQAQLKSQYQTSSATDQGISSMGGDLMKVAPAVSRLASGPNKNPYI